MQEFRRVAKCVPTFFHSAPLPAARPPLIILDRARSRRSLRIPQQNSLIPPPTKIGFRARAKGKGRPRELKRGSRSETHECPNKTRVSVSQGGGAHFSLLLPWPRPNYQYNTSSQLVLYYPKLTFASPGGHPASLSAPLKFQPAAAGLSLIHISEPTRPY